MHVHRKAAERQPICVLSAARSLAIAPLARPARSYRSTQCAARSMQHAGHSSHHGRRRVSHGMQQHRRSGPASPQRCSLHRDCRAKAEVPAGCAETVPQGARARSCEPRPLAHDLIVVQREQQPRHNCWRCEASLSLRRPFACHVRRLTLRPPRQLTDPSAQGIDAPLACGQASERRPRDASATMHRGWDAGVRPRDARRRGSHDLRSRVCGRRASHPPRRRRSPHTARWSTAVAEVWRGTRTLQRCTAA
ncbi:hypothetical protein FA09DRAFT_146006 [Tilletiopsis washingtonensis]|jgi:hypothetical protein|uniref:Uncharacterized protein n=1 Tax=Tilletiopsis washingtonensis TaxID=58919 RepID=A0A316Z2U6_9BASI|nr:hypothetical protein FA09DRAFT_146006 [Tilletiopsis washingtonensis]PWN95288.1 hypothetical protein FA09DRAFT_146006 [Tilletiopsis washingtonensis]